MIMCAVSNCSWYIGYMYHTIYIVNNNPFLFLFSGAWYSTGWVGPSWKTSEHHLGEIGRDRQCHWHHTASAGEWAGVSVQLYPVSTSHMVFDQSCFIYLVMLSGQFGYMFMKSWLPLMYFLSVDPSRRGCTCHFPHPLWFSLATSGLGTWR